MEIVEEYSFSELYGNKYSAILYVNDDSVKALLIICFTIMGKCVFLHDPRSL